MAQFKALYVGPRDDNTGLPLRYLTGIPTQDYSDEDWRHLSQEQQDAIAGSEIYQVRNDDAAPTAEPEPAPAPTAEPEPEPEPTPAPTESQLRDAERARRLAADAESRSNATQPESEAAQPG